MNTANKQYGRLTKKGGYTKELDLKQELGYSYIYNRLSELEDEIEKGLLVPRYSILQDWQYGWWCVCEVDEQSRIIAQCKTEEDAKRKLEEQERAST